MKSLGIRYVFFFQHTTNRFLRESYKLFIFGKYKTSEVTKNELGLLYLFHRAMKLEDFPLLLMI